MLIVASTAMVDDQRAGRPVRWSARIALTMVLTWALVRNLPFQPFESLRV